jgi:hypothetical protein
MMRDGNLRLFLDGPDQVAADNARGPATALPIWPLNRRIGHSPYFHFSTTILARQGIAHFALGCDVWAEKQGESILVLHKYQLETIVASFAQCRM